MLVVAVAAVGDCLLEEAVALVAVAMAVVGFQVKLHQHYQEQLTLAEAGVVVVMLE
jgi:hypothetical protein